MSLCHVRKQLFGICIGCRRKFSFKFHHLSEFGIPREDRTLKRDVAKANWKITELCKEGRICEAYQLFDGLPERDVISWTALISGYVKCSLIEKARALFDRSDAVKNVVTWTAMLSGYLRTKRIFEARRLFDEMPVKNVVAWNTMIDGYVKSCMIREALELFERMEEKNVVSWNIVLTGLINCGKLEDAMSFFNQMPERNLISWTILISGLARNGRIDEARLLFDQMGDRNVVTWNVMITGYAQNMKLDKAYALFQAMGEKNAQSWNIMIDGFIQNNEFEKARSLFCEMPSKNVVSWTTMINGFVQYGEFEEALKMFCSMQRDGRTRPNEGTLVSILGACSSVASLSTGIQVHQVITKSMFQESEFLLSSMINMYSKCGELEIARRIFNDGLTRDRDLIFWNSMLAAYAHHGRGRDAIKLFQEMQDSVYTPNGATFIALLSACSHAGLVEEGLHFFQLLMKDESIQLKDAHYTCIIDLCVRAGRLEEAIDLISRLPGGPSSHTLGALLSGFIAHGKPGTGKLVMDELLAEKQGNSGLDTLVSNAYMMSGRWEEAGVMKSKRKSEGVKKQPGSSWVEIDNKFHVFVVGNSRCQEHENLHTLLLNLHNEMKETGVENQFSLYFGETTKLHYSG